MGCLCPKPLSLYLAPKVSTDDVSLIANCNLCQINPYVLILRTFPTSASAADQIDDCSVECGGFYVGGFSVSELVHQRHHQCTAASCWGGGRPTASKDGSWWVQHRENGNRRPVMACIYQAWLLAERQTIMWLTGYQMGTKLQKKFADRFGRGSHDGARYSLKAWELKICLHVIHWSAYQLWSRLQIRQKQLIHLWPITFMKGWMHNLCAHQHEMQRWSRARGRCLKAITFQ